MAKRDLTRNGTYRPNSKKYRKEKFDRNMGAITIENRAKNERILGVREIALEEYRKNLNINDAYRVINVYNKRIGREAFSKEIVDKWIEDYNKKTSRREFQR